MGAKRPVRLVNNKTIYLKTNSVKSKTKTNNTNLHIDVGTIWDWENLEEGSFSSLPCKLIGETLKYNGTFF